MKKDNLIFVELIFTVAAVYLFRDSYFVHTSTGSGVRGCVRALSGCWKLEVELHTKINFVPSSNAPQDYNTLHTTHHPSFNGSKYIYSNSKAAPLFLLFMYV